MTRDESWSTLCQVAYGVPCRSHHGAMAFRFALEGAAKGGQRLSCDNKRYDCELHDQRPVFQTLCMNCGMR